MSTHPKETVLLCVPCDQIFYGFYKDECKTTCICQADKPPSPSTPPKQSQSWPNNKPTSSSSEEEFQVCDPSYSQSPVNTGGKRKRDDLVQQEEAEEDSELELDLCKGLTGEGCPSNNQKSFCTQLCRTCK